MNSLLLAMVVSAALWLIWQKAQKEFRCVYCGGLAQHRQDCPYDLNREER